MHGKAPSRRTERHSEGTQPRRGPGAWIRRGLVWMIAGLLALAVIRGGLPGSRHGNGPTRLSWLFGYEHGWVRLQPAC